MSLRWRTTKFLRLRFASAGNRVGEGVVGALRRRTANLLKSL